MRIKSVRIRNFRSIADQTIDLERYTSFVGANGSGKSNVLNALNVFFGESGITGLDTRALTEEDFHGKNTSDPVEITIVFGDLSQDAKKDLAHYVRSEQLIVSAVAAFDATTAKAKVEQFGRRLAMKDFAPFFEAEKLGKKVPELKDEYNTIREKYSDLPSPGTKESMIGELRAYEERHPEKCEEIPSADDFYGISKGKDRLEKHIQWVYVPAVKDAATEQSEVRASALGKLLARTVRTKVNFKDSLEGIRAETQTKYAELLATSQSQLEEISHTLGVRLAEWAHKDARLRLKWHQDPEKAVRVDEPFAQAILGEGGFEGELTRFGHGLQRCFLLALLQELAGSEEVGGPRLILACEEPELYQHPPQARHLYNVLMSLSDRNSQVMIATHSPYFVSGVGFESVRMVRKINGASSITGTTHVDVSKRIAEAKGAVPIKPSGQLAKIHQALQPGLSEMFFASKVIFVEGLEDIAYITSYLQLMGLWDEYRRLGCHMVSTDGKSEMIQPVAVAKCLKTPSFAVFDANGHKPDTSGSKDKHRKDNMTILGLCGVADPDPYPPKPFWGEGVVMWESEIEEVVGNEIGKGDWAKFRAEADAKYGHAGNLRKNALHIASSLGLAWESEKKSPSLERLCEMIMAFATANE